MKNLPARLYICPQCGYSNPYRWVLAQHLNNVHGITKKDATRIAASSEYLANPIYYRVHDEFEENENDE